MSLIIITIAEDYALPAAALWASAVRYDVLERMMSGPLIKVACPAGEEQVGHDVTLAFKLFGLIPVGRWRLKITERDDARRRLKSEESGPLVRRWSHEIAVDAQGANAARLTDTIEIDAGALTPLIARFARAEYTRRHRLRKTMLRVGT